MQGPYTCLHWWQVIGSRCRQFLVVWLPSPHEKQLFKSAFLSWNCLQMSCGLDPWCRVPVACIYAWPAPGGRVTPGWRWPAVVGRWNRPGSHDDERCHAGVVRGISSFPVAYCDIFKFFSSFLVPAAHKCRPSMSKKSSVVSPPLVKKLSVWSIKTQSFSFTRVFSASFTAVPFDAASKLSVLGHIPLMITRPLTDFSFAVSMMRDIFSTIFSMGNFVDESFVPTWIKTSECDPGLYFFNIDRISPVLAPPFEFTHRVVSSFESTSLIVESPIRSRGCLFWPFISFTPRDPRSISFSDCICTDITSLKFLSAEISSFNVLFSVDSVSMRPHSLLTEVVSAAIVCGIWRQQLHRHQVASWDGTQSLSRQSSWNQL